MSMGGWLSTHRKQVITHTSIIVGFVLVTIFVAAPLFDRFEAIPDESRPVKIMLPHETANLCYGIDRFNVSTHLVDVSGWAFIDGQSSDNSAIYIVLKSDKNAYVFDTQPVRRPDVTVAFQSVDLDVDWSGFIGIIPLRKIQQGEYIIGLYISRGDTQALQYLDKAIVKSRGGVKLTIRMSKAQEISLPLESERIRLGIGRYEVVKEEDEKELIEIDGWAFIEGQSAQDSKIYVVLKSETATYVFDTILQKRPDVTAAYVESGLNLDNSGFIARIPKESIQKGIYRLGIYIKKDQIETLQYTNIKTEW